MSKQIGTLSETKLKVAISKKFQLTFIFDIMEIYSESGPSIFSQFLLKELVSCSGATLEQVKATEHGKKLEWMDILRIRAPNFGVAIKVTNTLSWMNFEAESISHICSDGSINIQSVWKSKEAQSLYSQQQYGSPQTWNQNYGIQNATKEH